MKKVLAAIAAAIVSLTAQADSILLTNFGNDNGVYGAVRISVCEAVG